MRCTLLALISTAVFSCIGLFLAIATGSREDYGSAIGGLSGFCLATGFGLMWLSPLKSVDESTLTESRWTPPNVWGTFYGGSAVVFALIGWLTGYLHQHGQNAGAISGFFGGLLVSLCLAELFRWPLLPFNLALRLTFIIISMLLVLIVVWAMYFTEARFWKALSMNVSPMVGVGMLCVNTV